MQIKKFHVENFKGIKNMETNPGNLNVLIGDNGSGKSSFLKALRYALGGNSTDLLIRSGSKKMTMELELQTSSGLLSIRREAKEEPDHTVSTKLKVNGKTTTQKSLNQMLEEEYRVSPDMIRFVSNSEVLRSMSAGDFSQFLLDNGLIRVFMDLEKLFSLCEVSEEAKEELAMYFPEAPEPFTLSDINDAYDYYFEERASSKKDLAAHKARVTVNLEETGAYRSTEEINRDLETLLKNEGESAARKKAKEAYDLAAKNRDVMNRKIEEIRARVKADSSTRPNPTSLQALEEEQKSTSEQAANTTGVAATLKGNISRFRSILEELGKNTCPISKKLVCTTDKSKIRGDVELAVSNSERELKKQEQLLDSLRKKQEDVKKQIQDYHTNARGYQEKLNLIKQAEQLRENLPELPPEPDRDFSEKDFTILKNELKNELLRTQNIQTSIKEQAAVERIEKRLAVLEELLKLLHVKGGAREKALALAMQPFEDHCNERVGRFKTGFQIRLLCENGVHIQGKTSEETGFQEFKNLSAGEQQIAAFLVLDMINALTGLRLLVLDELESLDEETIRHIIALVEEKEVLGGYDHIFFAAVNHESIREFFEGQKEISMIRM